MQVLPALNRQRRREVDAKMRRITRKLEACGSCAMPLNGGEHFIDKLAPNAPDPTNKYNGVVSAVGMAASIPQFAAAQKSEKESPVILRRVTTLAALIGFVVTDQPKDKWRATLQELTTFQMAEDVLRLASRMKGDEAYAVQLALTMAFLKGATGDQLRMNDDPMVLGYRRAMAAFDRMIESIRKQSMAAAVAPSVQKLNGLGRLGATATPMVMATVATGTVVQPTLTAPWWSNDNELGKAYAEARRAAGSPGTTGPTPKRREMWKKWIASERPNITRAEYVNIVKNDPNDKTGYFEYGPNGYIVGSRDVVNASPAGGWNEGLVKGFYYEKNSFYPNSGRVDFLMNIARGLVLQKDKDGNDKWMPRRDGPMTIAEYVFFVSQKDDARGVFYLGGPNECKETVVRTDAAWIKEDCQWNATAEGDALARSAKVKQVTEVFKKTTGLTPTPCDINYYTRMRWCTEGTYIDQIQKKEAAGRPPLTDDEVNPQSTFDMVTQWVSDNIGKAFDLVVAQLQKMQAAATGFLCAAFEKLFTGSLAPVAGVLCAIVKLTLGAAIGAVAGAVQILGIIFTGIGEFFANLFSGQLLPENGYMKDIEEGRLDTTKKKGAVMALVDMINMIVVTLLGASFSSILGIPLNDEAMTAAQKADGTKSLKTIGRQLPPTFTIMLVSSVISLIFSMSGGPQGITIAVSSLIITLTPAIALIVAPKLKASIARFRDVPMAQITAGLSAIVKIGAMILVQVMNLEDTFNKFAKALERYWNKLTGSDPKTRQELANAFATEFPRQWNRFVESLKAGQLSSAADGAKALAGFIPDLLLAIAQTDPDLAEVAAATQQIVAVAKDTYEQAKMIWADAMKEFKNPQDAINAIRAQMDDFRKKLDELCADAKFKTLPACQFPKEQQTEKIVTVEKIIYRDRAPEPAKTGAVSGETKVTTSYVTPTPAAPVNIPPVGTTVRTDAGEIKVVAVSPGVVTDKVGNVVAIVPPPAPPAAPPPVVIAEPGTPLTPNVFVQPAKKGSATPLVLAAGGFAVGGPVGAAIGLVVGLMASK